MCVYNGKSNKCVVCIAKIGNAVLTEHDKIYTVNMDEMCENDKTT